MKIRIVKKGEDLFVPMVEVATRKGKRVTSGPAIPVSELQGVVEGLVRGVRKETAGTP